MCIDLMDFIAFDQSTMTTQDPQQQASPRPRGHATFGRGHP